ncbi:MAG: ABC transporter permease [Opitutaceae bacterium]
MKTNFSFRRFRALCKKEVFQIVRDPTSIAIAFLLPAMLLIIFGYGISLDSNSLRVGLVMEDTGPEARDFVSSLEGSPYLALVTTGDREQMADALTAGRIRGFVVISSDFSRRLARAGERAPIQVIADGSEPNTAQFVSGYLQGAWQSWLGQRAAASGHRRIAPIRIDPRYWYNPAAISRYYLLPGSITIIMTVIGALLTSLVVAREWERGTMEALLSTPVNRAELILSKLIPYYVLGIIALAICVGMAVVFFGVPFRGSIPVLLLVSSLFLGSALGMGLLISTVTRNQFDAAQVALNAAYLPALILSGFIFEIRSMPAVIQAVTYLIPARYFVTAIQTLFQAGDLWSILWHDILFLTAASIVFIGLTVLKTRRRLE